MMAPGLAVAVLLAVAALYVWHYAPGLRRLVRAPHRRDARGARGRGQVSYLPASGPSARELARREAMARVTERVSRMSLEEAQAAAAPLMRDARVWRPLGSPPSNPAAERLAPALRSLVLQGARIDVLGGALRIEASRIAEWQMPRAEVLSFGAAAQEDEPFLRIGTDDAGSPVVARPGEEDVYVVRGGESGRAAWSVRYASLYHWLLVHHGMDSEARRLSGP